MSDDAKIQKAIKNYLLKNPDYFLRQPDLVSRIELGDPQGQLTDLTNHQLRTLKTENARLKQQIAQLIHNAQQSESVMNRLFQLLLSLSQQESKTFLPQFVSFVVENFPADYFVLVLDEKLDSLPDDAHLMAYTPEHQQLFAEFKNSPQPLSGRLQHNKIKAVFPAADDIKSAVVLPLGEQAAFGLMAFASRDEEKFHPSSATDLLQMLASILNTWYGAEPATAAPKSQER